MDGSPSSAASQSPWTPFESRRRARDEKREAVLRTAVQLFLEQGYHGTTLNDVAERLNITKPALYNYFRGKDEIKVVCSGKPENAKKFAAEFGIPRWTADMAEAIRDPEIDTVIIGIPNYLHKKAVLLAAEAGKAILCTKPLAMNGPEALEMLEAVENAGVFSAARASRCKAFCTVFSACCCSRVKGPV